jgi:hypothetical protein
MIMKIHTNPIQNSYVKISFLILCAAIVFPFVIHLIPPINGTPVGAFFLPMFYIPFVALFLYGWRVALPIALLAPVLNFVLTGNPNWEFLSVLTLELLIFTVIAHIIINSHSIKFLAAPLGYIIAKVISSILLMFVPLVSAGPIDFIVVSLTKALPGIIILLLINILIIRFEKYQREKHQYDQDEEASSNS